eukprot:TRINITY_DN7745_c0_g1_i1.p1 TRINITY_DN7745_c0_g1~~TRINITY_DN7745_c0_g1_i1.p1  ORF type:complete len:437 (-),score=109.66 TRINITY_DN7745_c0_g1_i1:44-1354(-)
MELQKVKDLFEMGFIQEEEYVRRVIEITGSPPTGVAPVDPVISQDEAEMSSNRFGIPEDQPKIEIPTPDAPQTPISTFRSEPTTQECSCGRIYCSCGASVPECLEVDHKTVCQNRSMECPNRESGCQESFSVHLFQPHLKNCNYNIVICKRATYPPELSWDTQLFVPPVFCNRQVLLKDLRSHWEAEHSIVPYIGEIPHRNILREIPPGMHLDYNGEEKPAWVDYGHYYLDSYNPNDHQPQPSNAITENFPTETEDYSRPDGFNMLKMTRERSLQLERDCRERTRAQGQEAEEKKASLQDEKIFKLKQQTSESTFSYPKSEDTNPVVSCPLQWDGCQETFQHEKMSDHLYKCQRNIIRIMVEQKDIVFDTRQNLELYPQTDISNPPLFHCQCGDDIPTGKEYQHVTTCHQCVNGTFTMETAASPLALNEWPPGRQK